MKTISKMYFKYQDILKSESENQALEINSYIRCYVKMTHTPRLFFSGDIRFAVDVINDKDETSKIMIFNDIKEFNAFVKLERWLND